MLSSFQSWLAQPFNGSMSAGRWFAFVGLLIAFLIIWGIILRHLREV